MTAVATAPAVGASVWRDPSFRRLWAGLTVSKFGTSVASVATPLIAVQVLDADAFTVSLLTAAAWLPWLLIGLPAGAWIDRVAKRPVLIGCDLASALLVASIPAAAWLGHLTMPHLLAVALLVGTAAVFFQVAWTAYVPELVDRRALVRANSVLQGSESAVQIAGPALAGLLVAAVSAVAGLALDAISFAASAVFLLLIRGAVGTSRPARSSTPSSPSPSSPSSPSPSSPSSPSTSAASPGRSAVSGIGRDIAAGVRWLAREPLLRSLTIHGAAGNLALTGYGAITVVFLVRDLGVNPATVGVLMAASGIGGVAAAPRPPVLAPGGGAGPALGGCQVGAGGLARVIPLSTAGAGLTLFALGTGLVAACVVAGNVIAGTFRQTYVPPALLARVVTGMQFVNLGAIPLGALLGGALATMAGTRWAIAVLVIGYALAGLILLRGPWRGRRDLPSPDRFTPVAVS